MDHEVTLATVAAQTIASVRERVTPGDIAARFGPALDQVWQFVRGAGIRTGHNVFLYDDANPGLVEFAVQVDTEFADDDVVACRETPAGTVATTVHMGPYDQLGPAHAAIRMWCRNEGRPIAGLFWEVYGDWDASPARLRTDVFYLLA
jgi:effector-binding domain-containing protein